MKVLPLLGLAVLCLLPRASALVIQSGNLNLSAPPAIYQVMLGTALPLQLAQQPLTSINVALNLSITVNSGEVNPYQSPISLDQQAAATVHAYVDNGVGGAANIGDRSVSQSVQVTIPPSGSASIERTFDYGVTLTLTDSAAFAAFTTGAPRLFITIPTTGNGRFAPVFSSATGNWTIAYNAPDSISTGTAFGAILIGLAVHYRRRSRGRFGA